MACVDMGVDSLVQNNRGSRVRGGGRGMGLRGVRGSVHVFKGVRQLDGYGCRGPLRLRGVRGPGGMFRGARRLDVHPCRGPLELRGVRGRGGMLRGVGQLEGPPRRGPLGLRGARGTKGTFGGARHLDGHPSRGPLGMSCVRGPRGTFGGAGRLDGPPRRGPLGMHAITKTVRGTRNLPRENIMVEDGFKAVETPGVENGTKLLVSNLNAGVSNEDIRGVFSEIGELIRYGIHYDKDGSPCGSAEVVFVQSSDAFEAVKRYNNTDLNGNPMKIEKVGGIVRARVASRLNMTGGANGRRTARMMSGLVYMRDASVLDDGAGPSRQRGRGGWNDGVPIHGRGRRGRGHRHGGLGGRPVERSAEELDKEQENSQAETGQT